MRGRHVTLAGWSGYCSRLVAALFVLVLAGPVACAEREGGKPGDLLSKTPIAGAPDGATAWRIRYRTLDDKSAPVEVTGIVIVPAGAAPDRGRDVVSWGRGTVGLAPVCAPSKTPNKMFEKTPGIRDLLKRGYIVTASDFADPDSGRAHPYLVGLAEGHAMLDAVRAVESMPEAKAGKRYALSGESEGAHAALWAAKLAPTYAPGRDLVGIAVAAPPTDLVANFQQITSPYVHALLTGYVAESWSKVYDIPLSTFANPFGRLIIRQLAKDCTRFDMGSAFVNTSLLILANQVPHTLGPPWKAKMEENSFRPTHLSAPLLIAQGGKDDVVMPGLTQTFAEASCRLGDDVDMILKPDLGHLTIADAASAATVAWIAARFEGKPVVSDCAVLTKPAGAVGAPVASRAAE